MTREYHILNLGAGVQSTALYLMSMRRDEPEHVPAFDYAIFADTQEEPDEVYRHLGWLESLGGPPILRATFGKLGDDLVYGHHEVVRRADAKYRAGQTIKQAFHIPAFVKHREAGLRPGIITRKCTGTYKIEVIGKAIRRQVLGLSPGRPVPKSVRIVQYFGLSYDEPTRVIKAQAKARGGWFNPRFPLFDLEMTRGDCLAYLRGIVPHETPRSACSFCPYHSNAEWRRIRDADPKAWDRACEVDEGMRRADAACAQDLDGELYVHPSCLPLREAPIDDVADVSGQSLFGFASECEGMCGV